MILFLIGLAGFFKAVADTLDDHFDTSIFKNKNSFVWDANRSTVKPFWITGYKIDPWHICNSLMIVCFALAVIFNDLAWQWWIQALAIGATFNIVFGIAYKAMYKKAK